MPVTSVSWFTAHQECCTLTRQKSDSISQNGTQKRESLLLASKTNRKWLRNCKHKAILEKRLYTYFAVWGIKHWSQIIKYTRIKVFFVFSWSMLICHFKMISIESVSPLMLLLLTLELTFRFEFSKILPVFWVYWFAT